MEDYHKRDPYSLKELHNIEQALPNPFRVDRKRAQVSGGPFRHLDFTKSPHDSLRVHAHEFHKVEVVQDNGYVTRFWVSEDFKGVAFKKISIYEEELQDYLASLDKNKRSPHNPKLSDPNFNPPKYFP